MKRKRMSITQIVRHLIQLAAFILFPGLFISTFSALGDIVKALVNGTFSVSALSAQLITVLGIFVITALWGRFFCGFLCSFGALQDLFAIPLKKFRLKHRFMPTWLERALKFLKFAMLAFIVVAVWVLALPVDSSLSPWGVFGMLTSGNFSLAAAAIPTVGFVLLFAIMLASMFIERFFCRYLCPLGAIFTLISGKRLFKISCGDTCVNCGLCTKKCAMGIDIAGHNEVTSGECIDCMQCLTACPRKCLSSTTTPAIAGTAAALVMCGLVTVGKITVPDSPVSAVHFPEEIESGNYTDGVYVGKGTGFRGDTEVQVTVENGAITEITVLSYKDNDEFFNRAKTEVISSILSSQSVDVDTVSGATYSSKGIIEAVTNVLEVSGENPNLTDTDG